jgi:hypothetical protein
LAQTDESWRSAENAGRTGVTVRLTESPIDNPRVSTRHTLYSWSISETVAEFFPGIPESPQVSKLGEISAWIAAGGFELPSRKIGA